MTRFQILDGPTWMALRDAIWVGDSRGRIAVVFQLRWDKDLGKNVDNKIPLIVNGATRENDSGESWLIEGYCQSGSKQGKNFKGFYRPKEHSGWIEI